jgi:hypothetical protein
VWYCDECLDILKILSEKIQRIYDHLLLHDEKFNQNTGKLDDLKKEIGVLHEKTKSEKPATYAEKLKFARNDPVVVIKPKNGEKTGKQTRDDVQKRIDPSVIPIKEMRNISQGSVVLECKSAESTDMVRQEVEVKLGNDYEVSVVGCRNPEIKVIGLWEKPSEENNENCVVEKIRRQNDFIAADATIEKIRIEEAKIRRGSFNIILRVDPGTYNKVMEIGKINVGWSRCRVVENIRVLRCFKCAEYGHKVQDCKNAEVCNKCAGPHNTKDCQSTVSKCINCERAKTRLGLTNISTDHPVWSNKCQVYERILSKKKKTINYYS